MRIRAHAVAAYVADLHQIPLATFNSPLRTRAVARPRQIAMYCIRRLCPHMSYPRIGLMMGNRDHTTILHGVQTIEAMLDTDHDVSDAVERVMFNFTGSTKPVTGPIDGALVWQNLCAKYSQAMRAAA